jgi:hypothetical protein
MLGTFGGVAGWFLTCSCVGIASDIDEDVRSIKQVSPAPTPVAIAIATLARSSDLQPTAHL